LPNIIVLGRHKTHPIFKYRRALAHKVFVGALLY